MRKITHLSLWCSQITDELVALHIRNLLDPVMGAHKFRWLWHYFRENLEIYLKRATDEDGGNLIKTSSSSSSWPQERRRGGGSSTWIKLRIASRCHNVRYYRGHTERQTGSERERNGRDRFGRRSGQSIERRGTSANNLEIGQSMVD